MSTQLASLRRFLGGRTPPPGPGFGTKTLIVGSGKGGVGTSLITALLALTTAEEGARTLLIDADRDLGVQHLLLGTEPGPGLGALRDGLRADELVVEAGPGLGLISCAPPTDRLESRPEAAEWGPLIRRLTSLASEFDYLIVDAGSRLDGLRATESLGRRRLLALSTTDRVGLAATHALIKASITREIDAPVQILFNRSEEGEARNAFNILEGGVDRFLSRRLEFVGALPTDTKITKALDEGRPIPEATSGTELSALLSGLRAQIIPIEAHPPTRRVVPG